jgi:hypothetical protein
MQLCAISDTDIYFGTNAEVRSHQKVGFLK